MVHGPALRGVHGHVPGGPQLGEPVADPAQVGDQGAQVPVRNNAVDPGYTATDLNGHRGTQSVQEGTDAIGAMATIGPEGPTGTFTARHGPASW